MRNPTPLFLIHFKFKIYHGNLDARQIESSVLHNGALSVEGSSLYGSSLLKTQAALQSQSLLQPFCTWLQQAHSPAQEVAVRE